MLQIGINAILLPMVLVADGQYERALNADMGYEYEHLLYSPLRGADKDKLILITEKLRQYPEVEAAELTAEAEMPERVRRIEDVADFDEKTEKLPTGIKSVDYILNGDNKKFTSLMGNSYICYLQIGTGMDMTKTRLMTALFCM